MSFEVKPKVRLELLNHGFSLDMLTGAEPRKTALRLCNSPWQGSSAVYCPASNTHSEISESGRHSTEAREVGFHRTFTFHQTSPSLRCFGCASTARPRWKDWQRGLFYLVIYIFIEGQYLCPRIDLKQISLPFLFLLML